MNRRPTRRDVLLAALLPAMLLTGSMAAGPDPRPTPIKGTIAVSQSAPPQRLFISGHSLTNRPLPDYLAAIAQHEGRAFEWNMQYLPGSSVRDRTLGSEGTPGSGYRAGADRDGKPIDVLRHFGARNQRAPYDGLIITEQNALLETMIGNGTVEHVADFRKEFLAANPGGRTFLFASWLNVDRRDDPRRWIAYERAAAPIWSCLAQQIDRAGDDRQLVRLIPAAAALAALIDQAIGPDGVNGISAGDTRATMDRVFSDDVHLTETGAYYVALITHGFLGGALPDDTWSPRGLSADTAHALQRVAARFIAEHRRAAGPIGLDDCRTYISGTFAPLYLAYRRDTGWRDLSVFRAYMRWARLRVAWPHLLRSDAAANPMSPGPPDARR